MHRVADFSLVEEDIEGAYEYLKKCEANQMNHF